MIASISGRVSRTEPGKAVVEVSGIGYEVFLTPQTAEKLKAGENAEFQIYEQVKEDAHNLYGFETLAAKEMFEQLLTVNGVGPKVGLAILSAASLEQLQRALVSGDPELLKGVAGVGKKTAERIVIELRGKVAGLAGQPASALASDAAYQALLGLGYTTAQAAEAVAKLPAGGSDQDRIKAALAGISK